MNEELGRIKYLQSVLWLTFIWVEIITICQHTEISLKGVMYTWVLQTRTCCYFSSFIEFFKKQLGMTSQNCWYYNKPLPPGIKGLITTFACGRGGLLGINIFSAKNLWKIMKPQQGITTFCQIKGMLYKSR